jgi:hypothetical protein
MRMGEEEEEIGRGRKSNIERMGDKEVLGGEREQMK